jgi:hypothetical protein
MQEDLAQLSPAQRSRALRNLKEARINLLKMLLASPDNVATLVLVTCIVLVVVVLSCLLGSLLAWICFPFVTTLSAEILILSSSTFVAPSNI